MALTPLTSRNEVKSGLWVECALGLEGNGTGLALKRQGLPRALRKPLPGEGAGVILVPSQSPTN